VGTQQGYVVVAVRCRSLAIFYWLLFIYKIYNKEL